MREVPATASACRREALSFMSSRSRSMRSVRERLWTSLICLRVRNVGKVQQDSADDAGEEGDDQEAAG